MRYASDAKNIPVRLGDGALIAHQQGRHDACCAFGRCGIGLCICVCKNGAIRLLYDVCLLGQKRSVDGFARLQSSLVAPGAHVQRMGQSGFFGGCLAIVGAHIARGAQPLLPQPEFVVKTMGVAAAVGLLQAHDQPPAFARLDAERTAVCFGVGFGLVIFGRYCVGRGVSVGRSRLRANVPVVAGQIPGQAESVWQSHRFAVERGAVYGKGKAHAVWQPLRQVGDLALHHDVTSLQISRQDAGCIVAGAPAGTAKDQCGHSCQQNP